MRGFGRVGTALAEIDRNGIPESRVVAGGCTWEDSPQFAHDFQRLLESDEFGAMTLLELRDSTRGRRGLSRHRKDRDYRVPLTPPRHGAKVLDPPWMGELKATGEPVSKSDTRPWGLRLYFGEPLELERLCVALAVGLKDPRANMADQRQADHIRRLMNYLKKYFSEQGYSYRLFEDRS